MAEYIEREAAITKIREEGVYGSGYSNQEREDDVVDMIDSIPAADVRPVVRGKWIEHYEPYSTGEEWIEAQYGYECSICGRWEYEKEPFCNCGADMREES